MPSPQSMGNDWSAWLQVRKKKNTKNIVENPAFNLNTLIPWRINTKWRHFSNAILDKITNTTLIFIVSYKNNLEDILNQNAEMNFLNNN